MEEQNRNEAWNQSEGRDIYHDWVDDVASVFVQNRAFPAVVGGLAEYVVGRDCQIGTGIYLWERK